MTPDPPGARLPLLRQIAGFAGAGVFAAIAHYGVLIGLVEIAGLAPVPATLAGYVCGGVVSYALMRTHAFASARPHAQAGWRFAVVACVGFLLTGAIMALLTGRLGAPYLPAQLLTTAIVLVWSFAAHKWWTFRVA